jgi:hypothetical protein
MIKPIYMKTKKNLRRFLVFIFILSLYPLFVLGYTFSHVYRSDLPGGRHGPLDAYRHALASAVVSYTMHEKAVHLITSIMERAGKASNQMDRHNNHLGAKIGAQSSSFHELEPTVRQHVKNGAIYTSNREQITWLPKEKWRHGKMW